MIRPEQIPITTLLGADEGDLDDFVVVRLPQAVYSLRELETLLGVMKKYRALCHTVSAPVSGSLQ